MRCTEIAAALVFLLMGLTAVAFRAGKSMAGPLMMGVFGLMLAMVGTDGIAGTSRFVYGRSVSLRPDL